MVAQTHQADQEISWTPQDDVLLNNAVETGASCEHSKKNKCFPEKRKLDDVRQENDAKQKRICNEPLDSTKDPAISIGQTNIENILPNSFGEKTALVKNCSAVEELGQFKEVSRNLLKADGAEKIPSISHQTQKGDVSGSSRFRSGKVLNLTIPDRGASFHSSSAPSDSPLWTPIEGFSTPKIPDMGTSDIYESVANELGFNVGLSEVMPENHQLLCGALRNSVVRTDDYLEEISNSLFDFTNEEENHLMGSDYIDACSSLLLDSPSQNGMPNIVATEEMVPSNDCAENSDCTCCVEVIKHPDGQERPSDLNPEYHDGVISCVLNTEDRDVPCNDDVFLLTGPSLSKFASPFEMQGQIYEAPSVDQKVNADPNLRTSERNSLEPSPVTEETLQDEEDPYNSDVEILL